MAKNRSSRIWTWISKQVISTGSWVKTARRQDDSAQVAGRAALPSSRRLFGAGVRPSKTSFRLLEELWFVPEEFYVPALSAAAYEQLYAPLYPRFDAKLPLTSLGYVCATLTMYFLGSALSEGLNQLVFGRSHPLLDLASAKIWTVTAVFVVTHSLFFLGGAFFKRLNFIKTALSLNVLVIVLGLFAALITWIFFSEFFHGFVLDPRLEIFFNNFKWHGALEGSIRPAARVFFVATKIFFWAILAPLCWVIAYLRFRETEV